MSVVYQPFPEDIFLRQTCVIKRRSVIGRDDTNQPIYDDIVISGSAKLHAFVVGADVGVDPEGRVQIARLNAVFARRTNIKKSDRLLDIQPLLNAPAQHSMWEVDGIVYRHNCIMAEARLIN